MEIPWAVPPSATVTAHVTSFSGMVITVAMTLTAPAATSAPTVDSSALARDATVVWTKRPSAKSAVIRLNVFMFASSPLRGHPLACSVFRSYPETALALLKASNRSKKVDLSKDRPVRITKVILAVRTLPEQEPTQSNLTAGPNNEIGVGQIVRIEILADLINGNLIDHLLQRDPSCRLVLEHRRDGIRDFLSSAVSHGDIQAKGVVVSRRILGLLNRIHCRPRQKIHLADGSDAHLLPVYLGIPGNVAHLFLNQPQKTVYLFLTSRHIFGGKDPHRDHSDRKLFAPIQDLLQLLRPPSMPFKERRIPPLSRISSIAVKDQADVPRQLAAPHFLQQSPFVEPVQELLEHDGLTTLRN